MQRKYFIEHDPYTLRGVFFESRATTARGLLEAAARALARSGDMTTTGIVYRVTDCGCISRVNWAHPVEFDLENNVFY